MKRSIIPVVTIAATLLSARAAVLGTYIWKGGDGNWSDENMWEGGVPPATDTRDPNDYYEIYLRPLSNTHYVINLDQETVYKNTHLKVQSVQGIENATITLSGGRMEFRQASGPGVNNCSGNGVNLQFKNCEIVLPGFNPFGGTITFGEGAKITSSANCYFSVAKSTVVVEDGADVGFAAVDTRENIKGSRFVVNGGKVSSSSTLGTDYDYRDFLYQFNGGEFTSTRGVVARADAITTIEVNGGKVRLPAIDFRNSESILRISGGELLAPKPINADRAAISLVGGCYNVDSSDLAVFMKETDLDYLPMGTNAVLDLHWNKNTYASTWVAMLTSNTENTDDYPDYRTNLLFSGTIQMTNATLAAFYTRGGDARPRIGKRGKLLFPTVFTRQKGAVGFKDVNEFDLDLFALSRGLHAADRYLTYDFLNGVTIGAFLRDWTSMGYLNNSGELMISGGGPTMRFNDSVTVDTLDQLDRKTPRNISLVKTAFNNVDRMIVKGGGGLWICATTDSPHVGKLSVEDGSGFEFAGRVSSDAENTNIIQEATLSVETLVVAAEAKIKVPADKVSIIAAKAETDDDATIEVNLQTIPEAGTITKVVEILDGNNRATTVLTGAAAEAGWQVKSLAGLVYLSDNTTAAVTGHDAEWYWTGAENGRMSVAGNWTTNTAPVIGAEFKPRFTGKRNMEIVNDLENGSCYNLYFTADCGPVSLSGKPLKLLPGGYGGETAAIYSASPYPVEINLDLARNGKFGVINVGDGWIRFNGKLDCGTNASSQYFVFKGSSQIGGSASAGAMLFFPKSKSVTKLTVLDGGVLTLAEGDATRAQNESEQTTVETPLWICSGGKMEVGTCFNTGKCPLTLCVDGTFDCESIAQSQVDLILTGAGEVILRGATPSEKSTAKRVVHAGGALTLRMSGDWNTITAAQANCPQTLDVNGDVKIVVPEGGWRYGHDESIPTATDEAGRAITIASGAKLTFAGGDGMAILAEPIVGPGTLDFDPTANVAPGGLLASAEWTTIADVGQIVKLPTKAEYKYRVVDGGENGKLLQAKGKSGVVIVVR